MAGPRSTLALILGKQGSGKSTRVLAGLHEQLERDARALPADDALEPVWIAGNHFNHLTYDADGDLAFVGGVQRGKALQKVDTLQGLNVLELPHSGYLPPGANRDLNNDRIRTRIFHLELPEAVWRGYGGSTGAITSPEYFMAHGRKIEPRDRCDYGADLARIRDDIARSGVAVERFDRPEAMIEPIRDFLLFSTADRWTDAQLRRFVALKMGKTRLRGFEGPTGLLGYQVIDFGNGTRSEGDTQTPEKLAFLVAAAGLPVEGRTFLDLGCNMGSVVFELKKRSAGACVGFDLYEPALEIARSLNRNWFQFADVQFVRQSIVDDWAEALSAASVPGGKFDYALALSVLHKDGVRDRLGDVIRNLMRYARHAVVEIPLQPEGEATDWDYRRVRELLEESFVVKQLPLTDFHSACKPRDLLLCAAR